MIMQIFENYYYFFGFLYYHFYKKKHKIKNKVGIKTTFLLMMQIRKAKNPKQVHFRVGWDESIFLKNKKTTNKHII